MGLLDLLRGFVPGAPRQFARNPWTGSANPTPFSFFDPATYDALDRRGPMPEPVPPDLSIDDIRAPLLAGFASKIRPDDFPLNPDNRTPQPSVLARPWPLPTEGFASLRPGSGFGLSPTSRPIAGSGIPLLFGGTDASAIDSEDALPLQTSDPWRLQLGPANLELNRDDWAPPLSSPMPAWLPPTGRYGPSGGELGFPSAPPVDFSSFSLGADSLGNGLGYRPTALLFPTPAANFSPFSSALEPTVSSSPRFFSSAVDSAAENTDRHSSGSTEADPKSTSNPWSLAGHAALSGGSFIPGPIGSVAALGDAGLSLKEGDWLGAGLSGLAALLGTVSNAGAVEAALKGGRLAADAAVDSSLFRRAFDSLRDLKNYLGSAGADAQWHHIVEQSQIDQFGANAIHSVENVVAVPTETHRAISGFYSSIQPFSEGSRVRDWLRGQSFEQQHQFGLRQLEKFLGD